MTGINCDPLNRPHGDPEPSLLARVGLGCPRLVLRPGVLPYIEACRAAGLDVLGLIARESGDPAQYVGWGLTWIQVGNEPDSHGPSSWSMAPEDYWSLWYRCRDLFPDTPLIIGGLASGNVWKGEQYWCVEGAHAIGVHPYGKRAPAAAVLLSQYAELSGMPLWVTEWWRPAGEIAEFAAMLEEHAERSWWFSWHSFAGWPGGLIGLDGRWTPEYYALVEVMVEMAANAERIALLEKQQALTVEVLKLILQGRWVGEMPHAEGLLKAINPADTDWSAVECPRPNR